VPKLHYTALSPEQMLERALGERGEIVARPRPTPRDVLAAWLGNFGVGVGGAIITGVGLYATGAPDSLLLTGSLLTGAATFAGMMIWHGSQDERSEWRNVRNVKRAVKAIAAEHAGRTERLQAQLNRALDELDAADEEVSQLRKALDEMARQRDRAVYDLTHERDAAAQRSNGRSNFVAPVELAPQDVRDATAMIRYRYDTGEHLSRRKATDKARGVMAWTEPQWDSAKGHLDRAGITRTIKGQTEYPQTLDEALALFGEYLLHAQQLSVPTVNKTLGVSHYVESDEG